MFALSADSASATDLSSFHCVINTYNVLHERASVLKTNHFLCLSLLLFFLEEGGKGLSGIWDNNIE